ncbi:MAG TPA: beta-ketoacyl-ACP synthase III [Thermoanaerobaculia bacterium]|nr:beta-ketoacyl-ACP synthase III [Thermoanaerobaculia bacterium]
MSGIRGRIVGTGRSVPERVLTNAELETMVSTSNEWIMSRTGISERRIASAHESLSSFAVPAATAALEMAGISGGEVDMVLCATVSPDMQFPATANLIQDRVGAAGAGAFDLGAGCTGFVYALSVAELFIECGKAKNVLVVGGEILSKVTDWQDRTTCVLFGDGAGAVVLQAARDEGRGVLGTALHSDGSLAELIFLPGGGSKHPPSRELYDSGMQFLKMRGSETFKIAVRSLAEVSLEVLASCGLTLSDLTWFVPHQANRRIIEAVGKRLEIPHGKTYINVDRYGNTSSASIPIALDELNRAGKLAANDVVLLAAFGAGLTWGAAVLRW